MPSVTDHPALVRALKRARWLHWGLVVLILFLGLGALQNGGRVQIMKRREADAVRRLRLLEANQMREARVPGWERRVREALEGAREVGLDIGLRDEWLAWGAAIRKPAVGSAALFTRMEWPEELAASRAIDAIWIKNEAPQLRVAGGGRGVGWSLATNAAPNYWGRGVVLRTLEPAVDGIARVASPEGDLVAQVTVEGRVELVDPQSGAHALMLSDPLGLRVRWIAWSPDARWIAVAGIPEDRSISGSVEVGVWDLSAVHATLAAVGLDWPRGSPLAFPAAAADPDRWIHTTRFLLGGLLVFVVMGAAIANQHLLLRRYEQAERAATERGRELDEARERMARSEKMRALGTLAAGVAHDFNNLLSVIQMSRQLVERSLRPTGVDRENLEQIGQAVEQGRTVVRSILGYSRDEASNGGRAAVRTILSDTLVLTRRQFLSGLEVTLEVAPAVAEYEVRRGSLEPILVNLLVNASEAMGGIGKVHINACLTADAAGCVRDPLWRGPWVCVSVEDTGPGISPDVLPHVFEPFFTTKKLGAQRGTGLGLATVWRIAEEADFGLRVDTSPGLGTRFDLLIPFGVESETPTPALPIS